MREGSPARLNVKDDMEKVDEFVIWAKIVPRVGSNRFSIYILVLKRFIFLS